MRACLLIPLLLVAATARTVTVSVTATRTVTVISAAAVTTLRTTVFTTAYRTQTTPLTETPLSRPTAVNNTFASAVLDLHNDYRRRHHAVPLRWNSTLYTHAQHYANRILCNGSLVHSGLPHGENLALGYSPAAAVTAWYDEIAEYDFSTPGFSHATGHFTQLVWRSTTSVGCAYVMCGPCYGLYIICQYDPPGNVADQYVANVLP
ncbi:AAL178Wp [Eremothecium gossypii ATCC 10895]|uniref:AAL178Wp n=1 Tax=Eremothecium gossypii (strain ATCC 10895 / CBS 109.51 / FGSC 9923 / NRRL Y-1056) TaxID=284811 RepID=Q75FA9_EREGS|nr:AAL178Wp [Eremothecium gossypii ATCC 10895]AAS50188.1 AAL178Wp [Eremothecium gossypii ATCC 10895]AEY94473.1 FAAL178Wp [Eremothecium gossypii FDAG1]